MASETEAKWTDTPWEAVPADEYHGWYITNPVTGATVCDFYFMSPNGGFVRLRDDEPNARLMVAAPDMYEALRLCKEALDAVVSPPAIKSTSTVHAYAQCVAAELKARAALAKATGGAK